MNQRKSCVLLFVMVLLVYGCGSTGKSSKGPSIGTSRSMVVLVPDPDGSVGRLTVSNQAGRVVLDKSNQASTLTDQNTVPEPPVTLTKEEIAAQFSDVLAIQPEPPARFMLYFETDSTELKPDSQKILPGIIKAVQDRASVDISIVGHTDKIGQTAYALELSRQRALAVSRLLIEKGVKKEVIHATSHGGENPMVKAKNASGTPENRRVEVIVR